MTILSNVTPVETKLEEVRHAANAVYEIGTRLGDSDIRSQALIILAALTGVRKTLGLPERDIRLIHTEGQA